MVTSTPQVASIGAGSIGGLPRQDEPLSAGTPAGASDVDKDAFSAMMRMPARVTMAQFESATSPSGAAASLIGKFAATQTANMRELLASARELSRAAPGLSMSEMLAFGNELTINMAVTSTQFTLAGNVAKSAGKGIDTLMRNQ